VFSIETFNLKNNHLKSLEHKFKKADGQNLFQFARLKIKKHAPHLTISDN